MTMSSIKVYLLESDSNNVREVRKFSHNLGNCSFKEFDAKLKELFPMLKNKDVRIYWKDDENDFVSVSSDMELAEASAQKCSPFKFYLKVGKQFPHQLQTSNDRNLEDTAITLRDNYHRVLHDFQDALDNEFHRARLFDRHFRPTPLTRYLRHHPYYRPIVRREEPVVYTVRSNEMKPEEAKKFMQDMLTNMKESFKSTRALFGEESKENEPASLAHSIFDMSQRLFEDTIKKMLDDIDEKGNEKITNEKAEEQNKSDESDKPEKKSEKKSPKKK